jgi:hypothetical protein
LRSRRKKRYSNNITCKSKRVEEQEETEGAEAKGRKRMVKKE